MRILRVAFIIILAAAFLRPVGFAQALMSSANYGIPSDTMSGGGGDTSTSANYGLKDTIGQVVAGSSASATTAAQQGYRVTESAGLNVTFVNGSGDVISAPTVAFSSVTAGQNATATLGVPASKIRVTNSRAIAPWSLTMAATSGPGTKWTDGVNNMGFDEPAGGKLTVDPSVAAVTSVGFACTSTGLTLGSSDTFNQGVVDSITLLTAGGSAQTNCVWNLTGVGLSQLVPVGQTAASYNLSMTLTVS
jgi:hypothetical protein